MYSNSRRSSATSWSSSCRPCLIGASGSYNQHITNVTKITEQHKRWHDQRRENEIWTDYIKNTTNQPVDNSSCSRSTCADCFLLLQQIQCVLPGRHTHHHTNNHQQKLYSSYEMLELCPTRHISGHFRDDLPSQSLDWCETKQNYPTNTNTNKQALYVWDCHSTPRKRQNSLVKGGTPLSLKVMWRLTRMNIKNLSC